MGVLSAFLIQLVGFVGSILLSVFCFYIPRAAFVPVDISWNPYGYRLLVQPLLPLISMPRKVVEHHHGL